MQANQASRASDPELLAEVESLRQRLDAVCRRLLSLDHEEPLPDGDFHLLECQVGEDRMAVFLASVEKVVPMALLTSAAEAAPYVLGLLNLHSEMLPVLDVLGRIHSVQRRPEVNDMIVICRNQGVPIGLAVQQVHQVFSAHQDLIQAVDRTLQPAPYVRGMLFSERRPVLLLSIRRLVAGSDLPATEQAEQQEQPPEIDAGSDAAPAATAELNSHAAKPDV